MNNRIEELKKQAMYTVYSHGAFGEPENYERLDVNKFAEILLKEAEAKYFSEGYLAGKTDGIKEGIKDCISHFEEHGDMVSAGNLQSHFGIE